MKNTETANVVNAAIESTNEIVKMAPSGSALIVAAAIKKAVAKKTIKPTATLPIVNATNESTTKKTAKPTTKKAAKPVAKKATKPVAKKATKPVAKKAAKPVAKKAAKTAEPATERKTSLFSLMAKVKVEDLGEGQRAAIAKLLKKHGSATRAQLIEALPDVSPANISWHLSMMVAAGTAKKVAQK